MIIHRFIYSILHIRSENKSNNEIIQNGQKPPSSFLNFLKEFLEEQHTHIQKMFENELK